MVDDQWIEGKDGAMMDGLINGWCMSRWMDGW